MLVGLLWEGILALPRPPYRKAAEERPRPFVNIPEHFGPASDEPAGVVVRSLAYAYFNVDLGRLTAVEADKVRAGGARSGNVGDIDRWDVSELVEAVEVKDLKLTAENGKE